MMCARCFAMLYTRAALQGPPQHWQCTDPLTNMHLEMCLKSVGRHFVGQDDIAQAIVKLAQRHSRHLLQLLIQQLLHIHIDGGLRLTAWHLTSAPCHYPTRLDNSNRHRHHSLFAGQTAHKHGVWYGTLAMVLLLAVAMWLRCTMYPAFGSAAQLCCFVLLLVLQLQRHAWSQTQSLPDRQRLPGKHCAAAASVRRSCAVK